MSKFLTASLLATNPTTPQEPAATSLYSSLAKYSSSILPSSVYTPPPQTSTPQTPAMPPPPNFGTSSSFLPAQPSKTGPQAPSAAELDARAHGQSNPTGSPTPPGSDPDVTSDILALLETGGATPLGTMPWSQNGGQSASSGPGGISWAKVGIGVGMVLGGVVLWRLVAR